MSIAYKEANINSSENFAKNMSFSFGKILFSLKSDFCNWFCVSMNIDLAEKQRMSY